MPPKVLRGDLISPPVTAALLYAGIVLCMWLPYGPHSGMGYETTFAQWSENGSWWRGFFYQGDRLRPYASTFYHLAYLLSHAAGVPGSFVTYGVVYCILWWARGFLSYLALTFFLREYPAFNLGAGALVLVHAADGALQWVGQMNQFGMLFWMLLSYYCGLRFVCASQFSVGVLCWLVSAASIYMSLWSYEAQLPLVLVLPLLPVLVPDLSKGRRLLFAATWYTIAAAYVACAAYLYIAHGGSSYQVGVMRSDFDVSALASAWWFNIRHSLFFLDWAKDSPDSASFVANAPVHWTAWEIRLLALGVSVCVAAWLVWTTGKASTVPREPLPPRRALVTALIIGGVLLILSFPVFLLLNSARGAWRTQFISGLGTGLTQAAIAGLFASILASHAHRSWAFALVCGFVCYFGVAASIRLGGVHYGRWERHRFAIAQVLKVAPAVTAGSTVILTNVPREADPFGDNMWYLVALQLAYPKTPLAGVYFLDDHTPAKSFNLRIEGDSWTWNGLGWPPSDPRRFSFSKTIFVEYRPDGNSVLLENPPAWLTLPPEVRSLYSPHKAMLKEPSLNYGLRRYLRNGRVR